jgi:CheY-like chemotaxis protein
MPLTALVVDDSMLIRHTVCRFFEDRGFHVESATNGLEALEMLLRRRPDIIVTDLQMPKMDGHELIRTLRAEPDTAMIPVVVLAGKQSGSDEMDGKAGYIIFKDIDITAQLGKALEAVLPGQLSV